MIKEGRVNSAMGILYSNFKISSIPYSKFTISSAFHLVAEIQVAPEVRESEEKSLVGEMIVILIAPDSNLSGGRISISQT